MLYTDVMVTEGHRVEKPTTLEEYLEIQLRELNEYLEGTKIGEPKFLALCDRIEYSEANFGISKAQERLREAKKRGDKDTICEETDLRLAEARFIDIFGLRHRRRTEIKEYGSHFEWFTSWESGIHQAVLFQYPKQKPRKPLTEYLKDARDNILYQPTLNSTAPRPDTASSPTLLSSPGK